MVRFAGIALVLGLAACTTDFASTDQSTAVHLPNSGSGSVRSLRAMWKIKEIREACINYAETGIMPETLGALGFKAVRQRNGVLFSVKSNARNDKIELLLRPEGTGFSCLSTHRTFGGFGSSAIPFSFHTALNYSGWTQIEPAPQGNSSKVGNGVWRKGTTALVKQIDRKRSGKDSTGDPGYIMKVALRTSILQ